MEGGQDESFREIIRQGERMLAIQDHTHEAVLRRAGELLRLAVATLGGVIVIVGILVTGAVSVAVWAALVLAAGVLAVVVAAGIFALVLAGRGRRGAFAYGPDLRRVVDQIDEAAFSISSFLRSIVQGWPGWLEDNEDLMRGLQRRNGHALILMMTGVGLVLAALFYIVGGGMLG